MVVTSEVQRSFFRVRSRRQLFDERVRRGIKSRNSIINDESLIKMTGRQAVRVLGNRARRRRLRVSQIEPMTCDVMIKARILPGS